MLKEDLKKVEGGVTPGSPPFTPRAKKVLELSLREALQLGHNYIGTEHMLLGIIREDGYSEGSEPGAAVKILTDKGYDLSKIRSDVIKKLTGYEKAKADESPVPKRGMLNITLNPKEQTDLMVFIKDFQRIAKLDASHPLTMLSRKLK